MSALKEYAMGVCCAHPKEMFDLCDFLLGSEKVEQAFALALIDLSGWDTYPTQEEFKVMFAIDEILENVSQEDALVMMLMIATIVDSKDLMEQERSYWRGVCCA